MVDKASNLKITIKPKTKKFLVEIDAERLERLAAGLGLFSPDFLKSLDRAEKDYKAGRTRKIKSLKDLR
ncbi:MAG: hypothetical protein ACE5J0_02460 [Candidatus Paceibacterales bacterium]